MYISCWAILNLKLSQRIDGINNSMGRGQQKGRLWDCALIPLSTS